MRDLVLIDMLRAGVHFGHQLSRRHPKMEPYLYGQRGGVSIINLERTKTALIQAASFVRDLVASGGTIIFIGTKRQARTIVQAAAQQAMMPYIVDRWIGGLLTNFNNVKQLITKLHDLKEQRASGGLQKYTKKEQLEFEREINRLDKLVGGLASLEKLPSAVMVIDVKYEKTAVREAQKVGVPVIALCDSNVNPIGIDYVIPGNDDASKSISLVMELLAEAVAEGRQQHEQKLVATARAVAAAAAVPAEVKQ